MRSNENEQIGTTALCPTVDYFYGTGGMEVEVAGLGNSPRFRMFFRGGLRIVLLAQWREDFDLTAFAVEIQHAVGLR